MTSAAKAKGNAWEREICKFLGETLGGNFMRVPNSGAYMGGSNSHRKSFMEAGQQRAAKGDIIPPDDLPKLNLEAKNYKDIAFHQILDGECKQLDTWIEQTEEPADEDDISFTIFKITRKGSWVAFKDELKGFFDLEGLSYVVYRKNGAGTYLIVNHEAFFKANVEQVRGLGSSGFVKG